MNRFLFFIALCFLIAINQTHAKTVLITGASGGLGQEMVKAFQQDGWRVWAGCRKVCPEEFKTLERVSVCKLDLTSEHDIQHAVEKIIEEDGKIDLVINNASYGIIGAEECVAIEDVRKIFDVNVFGAMRLIQEITPHMRQAKSGHIINISSTSGVRALGGLGVYAATKFALEGYSEGLAVTLSPWNIHVTLVQIGTVNNAWAKHCVFAEDDKEETIYTNLKKNLFDKLVALAPSGQSGSEIAEMVVQIAKEEHPHMRYQTSNKVLDTVKKKLSEPSGDNLRDEQVKFFQSLVE